jgi:hypothetical protein
VVCDEKMRLITAYTGSTERYAIAVTKLRLSTSAEFSKAFIASELARAQCGIARHAIEKHRKAHAC